MAKLKASGALFQKDAKTRFLDLTRQTYANMVARIEKKNLPPLLFSREDFRYHVLTAMNGSYDGVVKCRYCNYYFTIAEIAVDHAIPLSRGGSTDLDNLEFPCRACNARKGSLTPTEYLKLLAFLEKEIPLGRQDVLNRLEISVQLVTSARANAATIGTLKKSGQWQEAQASLRKAKNATAKF